MSSAVETRVAELKFNNKQFEAEAKHSIDTLNKLKASLQMDEATKGLENLSKATKAYDMNSIGQAVDKLNGRFSAFGIAGMTVMSEMTKSALNLGKTITKSVIDPIIQGGKQRATNITNAKFQLEGLGVAWESIKGDIDYGVADTAYGFGDAAKVAGQLAASGVQIGENMKQALRGISGVAAMTNSEYGDIGRLYAKIASQGRVMAIDLNSFSARGMNVLAELGKALNKTEAEIKDMVSKGKIDFKTFASVMDNAFGEHAKEANRTFDGVLRNIKSAMSRIGEKFYEPIIRIDGPVVSFLEAVRQNINAINKALDPFVKVYEKTLFQIVNMLTERVKSIDAEKRTAAVLKLGEALVNVYRALMSVIVPIGVAFKQAFPKTLEDSLVGLATWINEVTKRIRLSSSEMKNLTDTVKGILDVVALVGDVIKMVLQLLFPTLDVSHGLLNIVLRITGFLGRVLSLIVKLIRQLKIFEKILTILKTTVLVILYAIAALVGGVISLVNAFLQLPIVQTILYGIGSAIGFVANGFKKGTEYIASWFNNIEKSLATGKKEGNLFLTIMYDIIDKGKAMLAAIGGSIHYVIETLKDGGVTKLFADGLQKISDLFEGIKNKSKDDGSPTFLSKMSEQIDKIKGFLPKIADWSKKFFGELTASKIVAMAVLITTTVLTFRLIELTNAFTSLTKSATSFIKGATSALFGLRKTSKPNFLKDFSTAIISIAGSMYLLSTIPADKLDKVITAMFKIVAAIGAIYVLNEVISIVDRFVSKLSGVTAGNGMYISIASFGFAVLMIAASLKILSDIKTDGLFKKVIVIITLISAMTGAALVLNNFGSMLPKGALTLLAMGVAMKKIVEAFNSIVSMNVENVEGKLTAFIKMMMSLSFMSVMATRMGLGGVIGLLAMALLWKRFSEEFTSMLDNIKPDTAQSVLIGLMFIIGGIVGIATAFAGGKGVMTDFGKGLIKMVAAIGLLVVITKLLSGLNEEARDAFSAALKCLYPIGIFFAAFTYLSAYLPSGVAFDKLGKALVKVSFAVGVLAITSALFANFLASFEGGAKFIVGSVLVTTWLMALVGGLMVVSQFTKDANLTAIAAVVMSVGVIMLEIIAMAVMLEDFNDVGALIGICAGFGLLFVALAGMFKTIGRMSRVVKNSSVAIVYSAVIVIGEIIYGLRQLSETAQTNPMGLIASIAGLSITMLAFGGLLFIISKLPVFPAVPALLMVAAAAGAMYVIAAAIKQLDAMRPDHLVDNTVAMIALMTAFSICMHIITFTDGRTFGKNKLIGILTMATVMVFVATTLAALSQCDPLRTLAAMLALVPTMEVFSSVITKVVGLKSMKKENMKALLIMATAIVALGAALAIVATQSWSSILSAAVAMSATMFAMAGVLKILSSIKNVKDLVGTTSALAIIAGSLILIAGAFKMMGDVEWTSVGQLLTTLAALTGIMLLMGVITSIFPPLIAGLPVVTACIFGLSLAMVALGGAFVIASLGVDAMANFFTVMNGLDLFYLAGGLSSIGASLIVLGLGGTACILGAAGIALVGLAMQVFYEGFAPVVSLISSNNNFADVLINIGLSGIVLAGAGILMLAGAPGVLLMGGALVVLAIGLGLVSKLIDGVATAVSSLFGQNGVLHDMASSMHTAGQDAIQGLVDGIRGGFDTIKEAIQDLGDTFWTKFREVTTWGSPWADMIEAGSDAILGLAIGLKDKEAGAALTKAAEEKFSAAKDQILGKANSSLHELLNTFLNSGVVEKINSYLSSIGVDIDINRLVRLITGEYTHYGDVLYNKMPSEAYHAMKAAQEKAKNPLNTMKDQVDDLLGSLSGAGSGSASTKDIKAFWEEVSDTLKNASSPFEAFNDKVELTGEQLMDNLASQINGTVEWAANLKELLSRGLSDQLYNDLAKEGVASYEKVSALMQLSEEELLDYGKMYQEYMSLPEWTGKYLQNSWYAETKNAGRMWTKGFVDAVDMENAYITAEMFGETTLDALTKVLDINSPSGETRWRGKMFGLGFDEGADSVLPGVVNKVTRFGTDILDAVGGVSTRRKFYESGKYIIQGLRDGIDAERQSVLNTVISLAEAVNQAARDTFGVASPSKVFAGIGGYLTEGLANGIARGEDNAVDAASHMADSTVKEFQRATKVLEWDMDLNPVITPTLDLSYVKAGAKDINSLLSGSKVAGSVNNQNDGSDGSASVGGVTYNQYNYSPKALSRIDIYRQTKNLLY